MPVRETLSEQSTSLFRRGSGCAAVLLLMLAGCSPTSDPVSANQLLGPGDEASVRILNSADRHLILDVMREAAVTNDPIVPHPARHGVRWSDVESAARLAASNCDMAVVRRVPIDGGWRFELITARNEPGELIVLKRSPPQMFETSARIGSFGNRTSEAGRLQSLFGNALRELGAKPGFEDDGDDAAETRAGFTGVVVTSRGWRGWNWVDLAISLRRSSSDARCLGSPRAKLDRRASASGAQTAEPRNV